MVGVGWAAGEVCRGTIDRRGGKPSGVVVEEDDES